MILDTTNDKMSLARRGSPFSDGKTWRAIKRLISNERWKIQLAICRTKIGKINDVYVELMGFIQWSITLLREQSRSLLPDRIRKRIGETWGNIRPSVIIFRIPYSWKSNSLLPRFVSLTRKLNDACKPLLSKLNLNLPRDSSISGGKASSSRRMDFFLFFLYREISFNKWFLKGGFATGRVKFTKGNDIG